METKLIVNDDGYSIFENDKLIMKFDENKVIRFRNMKNVLSEYDKNGMCIHSKDNINEFWAEYNEHKKLVHCIFKTIYSSFLYEYRYSVRLAEKGYSRHIPCKEIWIEYDENDNEAHFKADTGFETFSAYDDYNRIIYHKCISDEDPFEIWIEYDEVNKMVYYKTVKENGDTIYLNSRLY